MSDQAEYMKTDMASPAVYHTAITPADGVNLSPRPRAMYILTDGDIAIRDATGTVIVYPVIKGQVFPFRATGVEATSTTATMVGWL